MLESEKVALSKSLEDAKAVRDEAIAMAASLKSKHERLIRMAKVEAKKMLAQALSEKE